MDIRKGSRCLMWMGPSSPPNKKNIPCHPQRLPKSQVIYHIINTSGNCLDVPEVGFCLSFAGHPLKSWWYLACPENQLACPLKRYACQQGHESSSNHPFFLGRTVGFQGVYIVVVFYWRHIFWVNFPAPTLVSGVVSLVELRFINEDF